MNKYFKRSLSLICKCHYLRRGGRARVHTARKVPQTQQRHVLCGRQRHRGDGIGIGRIHIVIGGRGRGRRDGRINRVIDVAGNAGETRRVRAALLIGQYKQTQEQETRQNFKKSMKLKNAAKGVSGFI